MPIMLPDGLKRSAYHPNDGCYSCVCYFLPAAGALLLLLSTSSVFALQEETSLGDNEGDFAGGIVSDVLGSVEDEEEENDGAASAGNDDDDTNKQIAAPITEQD